MELKYQVHRVSDTWFFNHQTRIQLSRDTTKNRNSDLDRLLGTLFHWRFTDSVTSPGWISDSFYFSLKFNWKDALFEFQIGSGRQENSAVRIRCQQWEPVTLKSLCHQLSATNHHYRTHSQILLKSQKNAKCNKIGASKIIFYLLISISENNKSLGNHLLTIWIFINLHLMKFFIIFI